MPKEMIYGLHSVQSLLKASSERVTELYVLERRNDQRLQKIIDLAKKLDVAIVRVDKPALDKMSSDSNHQGVCATVKAGRQFLENDLYTLLEGLSHSPLLLILDGVTDPHNLGACLRSADAAGVDAVIVPKDNSASLTEVARKVASGAADKVPLIVVTNLARTMKKLQQLGVWITGAAGEANATVFDADLTGARAIVMGAEGNGLRRLTRENCDELVKIPMQGSVSSLNVSVATGILLFEVVRQRGAA